MRISHSLVTMCLFVHRWLFTL